MIKTTQYQNAQYNYDNINDDSNTIVKCIECHNFFDASNWDSLICEECEILTDSLS